MIALGKMRLEHGSVVKKATLSGVKKVTLSGDRDGGRRMFCNKALELGVHYSRG